MLILSMGHGLKDVFLKASQPAKAAGIKGGILRSPASSWSPNLLGLTCCPRLQRPSIAGFGELGAWHVAEFEKHLWNELGGGGQVRGRPLTRWSRSLRCEQSPRVHGKTTHHGAALAPCLTKMGSLTATHLEGWVWDEWRHPTESSGPCVEARRPHTAPSTRKLSVSVPGSRWGESGCLFACSQQPAQNTLSAPLWGGKHSCSKLLRDDRMC